MPLRLLAAMRADRLAGRDRMIRPATNTLIPGAALALAAVWLGISGPGEPSAAAAAVARADGSLVARVERPVSVRARPNARARTVSTVGPLAPLARGRQDLAVLSRTSVRGTRWLLVRLPKRPNGSRGWIPADAVSVRRTDRRLVIDLATKSLTLHRSGRAVLTAPVAVGKPGTPTPTGDFAVAEMIRTSAPGAFLGPVIFPLTGFSRTLNEYKGGDGRVAIHGTSLPQLIGTAASNGCVRMRNADVLRIARIVRPGDPVSIRPA